MTDYHNNLNDPLGPPPDFADLTQDLCAFVSGVVRDENEALFARLDQELPFERLNWPSGQSFNGWQIPDNWRVLRAELYKDGELVFDGRGHHLAVAYYSRSYSGELDWEELQPYLVSNPELPEAYMFHCMWQYRPWAADWALVMPHELYSKLGPGKYRVELETETVPGEMLAAVYDHRGRSADTIVFNANTCHPRMANDGFAASAILIRLFQWLQGQDTHYSYRLFLAPEHLGSVYYLRDQSPEAISAMVSGIFMEMPGTSGPLKAASTFLGGQMLDQALLKAMQDLQADYVLVPWRSGAGNDETVWEAPGYEVPFIELTRSESISRPYREYHSSLDRPELMNPQRMLEMYRVLQETVFILEANHRLYRRFDGLICLSNPAYDLYKERPDPTVHKDITLESEKWGHLLDCLFRYFDGSLSLLEIASRHELSFRELYHYILRFEAKGLIEMKPERISRAPLVSWKALSK